MDGAVQKAQPPGATQARRIPKRERSGCDACACQAPSAPWQDWISWGVPSFPAPSRAFPTRAPVQCWQPTLLVGGGVRPICWERFHSFGRREQEGGREGHPALKAPPHVRSLSLETMPRLAHHSVSRHPRAKWFEGSGKRCDAGRAARIQTAASQPTHRYGAGTHIRGDTPAAALGDALFSTQPIPKGFRHASRLPPRSSHVPSLSLTPTTNDISDCIQLIGPVLMLCTGKQPTCHNHDTVCQPASQSSSSAGLCAKDTDRLQRMILPSRCRGLVPRRAPALRLLAVLGWWLSLPEARYLGTGRVCAPAIGRDCGKPSICTTLFLFLFLFPLSPWE